MDTLAALAAEKEAAMKAAVESGLSTRAFSVYWTLKDDAALKAAKLAAMDLAREVDALSRSVSERGSQSRRAAPGSGQPLSSAPGDR